MLHPGCAMPFYVRLSLSSRKTHSAFSMFFSPNRGLEENQDVLLTHGDSINKVADGFRVIGQSGPIIVGKSYDWVHRSAAVLLSC